MKQQTPSIQSDTEFREAQDVLNKLVAKKQQVDQDLEAAFQERRDGVSPSYEANKLGVIELALQLRPGVEPVSQVEHEEWMRLPSILQEQSYRLHLAIGAQSQKVELARCRASMRLLGSAGKDYCDRANELLAAVDALITANAASAAELQRLKEQGLAGLPEVLFPDSGLAQNLVPWRDQLAHMVTGINKLAAA